MDLKELGDHVMVANRINKWTDFKWDYKAFVLGSIMQAVVNKESVSAETIIGILDSARSVPAAIALMHSELSEALEAYRKNDRENFNEELADLMIRLLHVCDNLGIDLEAEVKKKHEYNITRGYRHGNKII